MIVAGTTSYPRRLDPEPFRAIADEVGALLLFDAAHIAGLIAGGAHPNPVPYADVVTFTTHKTLRGPRGGCILSKAEHAAAIDKAVFPGWQGGPLEHVIAGKAVAFREAADPSFTAYAHQIVTNASALAAALAAQGFRLVSGGTDNHMMVVDLRTFDADLTGKEAQNVLDSAGITLNKNTIPDDPRSPFVTSGVRIGTPSVTTQGMKEPEMAIIAGLIARVLRERSDESNIESVRAEVAEIEKNAAEQKNPIAECIQPRKGHVARADHQRYEIVRHSGDDRHSHQEDHRGAVHREQPVERIRSDYVVFGNDELRSNDHRHDPGDQEKNDGRRHVHQAKPLVIDRCNPAIQRLRQREVALPPPGFFQGIVDRCHMESSLLQSAQIRHYRIQFRVRQMHRGHEASGLNCLWVFDPGAQIFGRVRQHPRSQIFTAHEVR